jgi:hypothetical protein
MRSLIDWRAVNRIYCALWWLAALALAIVIICQLVPGGDCASHCADLARAWSHR